MFNALNNLLPPDQGPFSFREIALTLSSDEETVYRAWECLHRRESTAEIVEPVDNGRPYLLTAAGAQRVVRHILNRWSLCEINSLLQKQGFPPIGAKLDLRTPR